MREDASSPGQPAPATVDGLTTVTDDEERHAGSPPFGAVVISVLYHPDTRRIGDRCVVPWRTGTAVALSRRGPSFTDPTGRDTGPLADHGLSRKPIQLICTTEGLRIEPEAKVSYRVSDRPLDAAATISTNALTRGIDLRCGRRVVLWIDGWPAAPAGPVDGPLDGISAAMDHLRLRVASLAPHDLPVAIVGGPGTGKSRVARALHTSSGRADGPWVAVDGGALGPGGLTGSTTAPGPLTRAAGGTLFVDGVGGLSAAEQAVLLRFLEAGDREPERDGSQPPPARVVCATDANLAQLAAAGRFSEALLHRLQTTVIDLPPLTDRMADVPYLFVRAVAEQLGPLGRTEALQPADPPWLPRTLVDALLGHGWPGNVRELINLARQTAIECADIRVARLPRVLSRQGRHTPVPDDLEMLRRPPPIAVAADRDWAVPPAALRAALRAHGWRVRPAADELGIARNTVYAMMGRLGIRRPSDLTAHDIEAACVRLATRDPAQIAAHLEVSERGLKLRLRALGLRLDP